MAGGITERERLGIETLAHDLENALRWLETFDLRPRATRFGQYVRFLTRVISEYERGNLKSLGNNWLTSRMTTCVEDGLPLVFLHRNLCYAVTPEVHRRLERFLAGPPVAAQERPNRSTNMPRDLGVELVVGAGHKSAELCVEFPEDGDLTLHIGDCPILLECKRPQGPKAIEKAVRKAAGQVRERLRRQNPRYGAVGAAVVEVGKIYTGGRARFRAPGHQEAEYALRGELHRLVEEYSPSWQLRPPEGIQVVLVSLSVPAWFDTSSSWAWMHLFVFNPVEANLTPEMKTRFDAVGDRFPALVRWSRLG